MLTIDFLLSRGECCGLKCKNCPYTKPHRKGNKEIDVYLTERENRLENRTKTDKSAMEKPDKKG